MNTFLQPILTDGIIQLTPLQSSDFDQLYAVASDAAIWEQHPNKDRYKKELFTTFFDGAMASSGAFLITEKQTGRVIGSTRYYDLDERDNSIFIGYTFFATEWWGKGYNHRSKHLLLNHIFEYVDKVYFHVGAQNIRSQKAMEKLGGIKEGIVQVAYHGEPERENFVYVIEKSKYIT